jgi:hypothetical protein
VTVDGPTLDDLRVARALQSNLRARWVLLALALLLPLGLHLLLERQARRLDALGEHGVAGEATVVRATSEYTYFVYEVGGVQYDWNVGRDELPEPIGAAVPIVYVPEDPALVRVGHDPTCGAVEAAENRRFGGRVGLGVFGFFTLFFLFGEQQIHELRTHGATVFSDPAMYRRRIVRSVVILAPLLCLVTGYHLADARAKGESIIPVVLALVLSLAILGGTLWFLTHKGRAQAAERSGRLLRILGPLAFTVAGLRLILWLVGGG